MLKARAIEDVVLWVLSILIAALVLIAGVPKLFGMEVIGLEAAAMRGFDPWLRIVVGIIEVVGAIGLLIPRLTTSAALMLAFVMVPATITQIASGEPGAYVPIILLVLLLLIAWRRNAKYVLDSYHGFADVPHPLLYDGVVAGFIGAMVIAVWFLLLDSVAGRPFHTPTTLGRALIGVFGPIPATDGPMTFVLVYTAFHFAAFMVVGLVASLVVFLARREPSILFAFIILFVTIEVGIYGLVSALHAGSSLGSGAWLRIMGGNLLAAVAMGIYFWRTHRELADEFRHSLDFERPEHDATLPPADSRPKAGTRGDG
jgi:uncharacterized membrane protein YphA (DoxX/SURF4 family)